MRSVWMLLVGIVAGFAMFAVLGIGFLSTPTVEPVSAYCRGFTEGFSWAYTTNTPTPLGQVQTDVNEATCMSDRLFAGEGWMWKGPLLP